MKRIIPVFFGGIIATILLFSACEKVVFPPAGDVPDNISYSTDIQPIWDSKCVSCHGGKQSPDLRPDVSYGELIGGGYINTDDPASSVLMQQLFGSHKSRASETEKLWIQGWISQGAKNN